MDLTKSNYYSAINNYYYYYHYYFQVFYISLGKKILKAERLYLFLFAKAILNRYYKWNNLSKIFWGFCFNVLFFLPRFLGATKPEMSPVTP